jgi:SAM-dependent methyltransferase
MTVPIVVGLHTVTSGGSHSTGSNALERTEQKLRPATDFQHQHGYIDVLGENPRSDLRRDQSVFRSRLLPLIYERFWRPFVSRLFFGKELEEDEERRIALQMLTISSGDSVLDVGCGTGNYARHLAHAAGEGLVVGMDASRPMIAAAARRGGGENLAYMRGDACALPFADGAFDVVCSVGVVHMLGEPMKALTEMVRVLAPGGRLVVVASYEEEAIKGTRGKLRTFGKDELTDALRGEGLTDIEQRVVLRGQFVRGRKPG